MKFHEVINEWYLCKYTSIKDSTKSTYCRLIEKHLLSELGNYNLNDINCTILNKYIIKKLYEEKLSSSYVSSIVVILNACMKSAFDSKLILEPIQIKKPKSKNSTISILTEKEQKQLISRLLCDMNCKNVGVLISLLTGIRIGELCALQYKDIIMSDIPIIKITKTLQRIKNIDNNSNKKTKIIITEPKSQSSIRDIPIPVFLLEILRISINKKELECYVLTGCKKFIEPRNFEYYFTSLLKDCDLKHYNVHALRHTFATNSLFNGMDIKTLSELLGHNDIETTLKIYVHTNKQYRYSEMQKLGEYYKNLVI